MKPEVGSSQGNGGHAGLDDIGQHHTVILGSGGSGKSYAVKILLNRNLHQGVLGYCVDPEGEYVPLVRAWAGRVVQAGLPCEGFDPFSLGPVDSSEFALIEHVVSRKGLIRIAIGRALDRDVSMAIDDALIRYYKDNHDEKSFRLFCGTMENSGEESERRVAEMLRPYASGSLRHLFNSGKHGMLEEEANLTVLDLQRVDPSQHALVAALFTETLWAVVAREPRPRILVFDEVSSVLLHAGSAELLLNLSKRARKVGLRLVTITQDVNEFLDTGGLYDRVGRTLFLGADDKVLLRQDLASVGAIKESFRSIT